MIKYILKRLMYILLALFVIISATFFLMRLAPGSPFASERSFPPQIEKQLNAKYGLDNPWYIQYKDYLIDSASFDFGESMKYKMRSTNDMISEGFPISLTLGIEAMLLAVGLGILLGVISALYHNRFPDYLATTIAVVGISIPSFVLAGLLQYFVALKLGWFPISGWKGFIYSILPAFAIAMTHMGFIAKLTRSSMLEQNNSDYVKMARAKGIGKWTIVFRHTLRNALLPVVTYIGPLTAGVVTGSFIVEQIFAIPGLGKHFVTSISNRDYTVIMGTTVFYSIILLLAVFIVDILYGIIDPRIKLRGAKK
ncbi:ABC transporter permease [Viridibacillus sp. FSL R5-0477]|uniref:Oligopeptide transport system permease n=1 Tax=Viridibacillus arenosi FSL R5-213 TaxID=1227360 RepID=W4F272_9BACL|nr:MULTISPECIES: ABC transporter permease [Viridibacillus]ETT86554.1 oligopeptide transport system permease [Viridibacillus arenosi FSL R5-213]OMC84571.1 peptide ABC transporter permease [Viridibacillus sp. FSL H8-0123]OMC85991.1 peptide ABC transporter permease [Viridibacillus sp. FSL H7-0596]OMC91620.1 peptide ABC transporter permease [Viridibacillus arenosi]